MNIEHTQALLWATQAIVASTYTLGEQARLPGIRTKRQTGAADALTASEYSLLEAIAMDAGIPLVAQFAGLDGRDLPQPTPDVLILEAAESLCAARAAVHLTVA